MFMEIDMIYRFEFTAHYNLKLVDPQSAAVFWVQEYRRRGVKEFDIDPEILKASNSSKSVQIVAAAGITDDELLADITEMLKL